MNLPLASDTCSAYILLSLTSAPSHSFLRSLTPAEHALTLLMPLCLHPIYTYVHAFTALHYTASIYILSYASLLHSLLGISIKILACVVAENPDNENISLNNSGNVGGLSVFQPQRLLGVEQAKHRTIT